MFQVELKCQECDKKSTELENIGSFLKTCSSCKVIRYCSLDCQKKNWKNHKQLCSKIKEVLDESHVFSLESKCANCKKTSSELKQENATLATCKACEIAQYCSKKCQIDHYTIHKELCVKYRKMPEIDEENLVIKDPKNNEKQKIDNEIYEKLWFEKFITTFELSFQSSNLAKINFLLESTEKMVCVTWKNVSPGFRFLIPLLLVNLGRYDEAMDCIYYLVFEYGKDHGRSLKLWEENGSCLSCRSKALKNNEPNFIKSMKKRNKFNDILNDPRLKGDYSRTLFGSTNSITYCGALFLAYIDIKLTIIKDLIAKNDIILEDLITEQEMHVLNMFGHMGVNYDYFVEFLLDDKPIMVKNSPTSSIRMRKDTAFLLQRLNNFGQVIKLKIMSDPWKVQRIKDAFGIMRARSTDSLLWNKFKWDYEPKNEEQ